MHHVVLAPTPPPPLGGCKGVNQERMAVEAMALPCPARFWPRADSQSHRHGSYHRRCGGRGGSVHPHCEGKCNKYRPNNLALDLEKRKKTVGLSYRPTDLSTAMTMMMANYGWVTCNFRYTLVYLPERFERFTNEPSPGCKRGDGGA